MNKRIAIGAVVAVVGLIVVTAVGILAVGGEDDRRAGALVTSGGGYPWVLKAGATRIGMLESLDGCRKRGTVQESLSVDENGNPVSEKALGSELTIVPCVMRFDSRVHTSLFTWIQSTLDGTPQRRDLTLLRVNAQTNRVLTEIEVEDALISRIAFPRLEKSSTSGGTPATFELTAAPDDLTRTEINGIGPMESTHPGSAYPVRTSGFRLALQGISDLHQASGIVDPIVVTQQLIEQTGGIWRYSVGQLEVGDLEVALGSSSTSSSQLNAIADVDDWYEDFVIQGNNGPNYEKPGTIELLDPNTNAVVLTLGLAGVGIYDALGPVEPVNSGRKGYRFYLDGVSLVLPGSATPPPPPPSPTTAPPPPPPSPPTTAPPPPPPTTTAPPPSPQPSALEPPAKLTVEQLDPGVVTLRWSPVEGAEKYAVLLAPASPEGYELLTTTEATEHKFELPRTQVFYVVVRSINAEGESANSDFVEIDTG